MNPHLQARPGWLLVAEPELRDPNFRRSVILLVSHNAEGSFGFVLNHPTGNVVADVVSREDILEKMRDIPVFSGGPVAQSQLILAGLRWQQEPDGKGALRVEQNPATKNVFDAPEQSGFLYRAFVGYSAWSPGQLDMELQLRSWIIVPPFAEILNADSAQGMWKKILRTLGPRYRLMAEFPEDPSLN